MNFLIPLLIASVVSAIVLIPGHSFIASSQEEATNGGRVLTDDVRLPDAPSTALIATWYGESDKECMGCRKDRLMANGEPYDETKMTAASNLLSLGEIIKVRYLDGEIEVKITDRMKDDNKIDLSKEAFKLLAPLEEGKIKVDLIY